jgi:flagellar biosynthesis protein FlhG
VRQGARLHGDDLARPKLIVVTGGKGGVGTTTIAVNFAVVAARLRERVILVDADLDGGDVAALCRLEEGPTVADVLSARRTVREVLQGAPGGIQVIPGIWDLDRVADFQPAARQRLMDQLQRLGEHAELIVLDAGSGRNRTVEQFVRAADRVLMVTSAEGASIMDTYAAIKVMTAGGAAAPIDVVASMVPDAETAAGVCARLSQACLRFLGIQLGEGGFVAADSHVPAAAKAGRPLVAASPECPATHQIIQLVETVVRKLKRNDNGPEPDIEQHEQGERLRALARRFGLSA